MNPHEFKNHQIRLRREEENRTLTENELQRANDALFASTLLDEDVVPGYRIASDSDNRNPAVSAINEISTSISRLTLSSREDSPPSSSTSHNQPSQSLEFRKKDRSQHTIKATTILENARETLRACAVSLGPLPTPHAIEEAKSTVRKIRHAVSGINRDVEAVIDLKRQIAQQLNNLEGRFTELRHLSPDDQVFTYVSGQLLFPYGLVCR